MNDSKNYGCSVGFSSMLTIVFVILKLCDVIQWNWLWVLSPLWIDLGLSLIIIIGVAIYQVLQENKWRNNKWRF